MKATQSTADPHRLQSPTRPLGSSPPTPAAARVAVCYGTRPQVIKASRLLGALRRDWDVVSIDTGQHYDYELNALLYEQLGIRRPDLFLDVGSGTHAVQTAAILTRAAEAFARYRPAAVVVIGDTNSTLGCALAAAKARIPVVHVEAGLRAHDMLMAEEINRRCVDATSSVLCAPSAAALETLRAERAPGRAVLTGDVAYDVLLEQLPTLPRTSRAGDAEWQAGEYVFATLHRAELTDRIDVLRCVLQTLDSMPLPIVMAVHPRTKAVLTEHALVTRSGGSLQLVPPVGYLESLALTKNAAAVVTDSGGLQREAYWLGVPCITLRAESEWTETVELGANQLLPPTDAPDALPERVADAIRAHRSWDRTAYGDGRAAERIRECVQECLDAPRGRAHVSTTASSP